MQKVEKGNSLVDVYKRALRISAFVFVFIFLLLYIVSPSLAVMWSFLACLTLIVITPVGAMNLANILTSTPPEGCCKSFVKFCITAFPLAFCGKMSEERKKALASADPSSSAGKFLTTRLKMAAMVEKTGMRIWVGMFAYMMFGGFYIVVRRNEVISQSLRT